MPLTPRFIVKEHLQGELPMVEVWLGPVFVCGVYADTNAVKIVSAHIKGISEMENVAQAQTVLGENVRTFSVVFDEKSVVEKLKMILEGMESEMK